MITRILIFVLLAIAVPAQATVQSKAVSYQDEETKLTG